ncbi:MAG TPA: SgcJ/EcaC family oxidoreductase [Acidimicrobiia bacterium]
MTAAAEPARPTLAGDAGAEQDARAAADRLVVQLQAGWDQHDADVTDRLFASDLLWGSPFGATLQGSTELHEIHVRLKEEGTGGPASRFEVVQVLAPTPDVALAHIRRVALGADGEQVTPTADLRGPFSEMALYVLVRRDGDWWVAAGQNTPVRSKPD